MTYKYTTSLDGGRTGECACSVRDIPPGAQRVRDFHGRVIGWADPPRAYVPADFAAIEARVLNAFAARSAPACRAAIGDVSVYLPEIDSIAVGKAIHKALERALDGRTAASLVDNKHDPYCAPRSRMAREDSPTGRPTQALPPLQRYSFKKWTSRAPIDQTIPRAESCSCKFPESCTACERKPPPGGTDEDRALAMRATQGDTAAVPMRFVAGADAKAGDMLAMRSDGKLYPSGVRVVSQIHDEVVMEATADTVRRCRESAPLPSEPSRVHVADAASAAREAYRLGVQAARDAIAAAKYDADNAAREWSIRDVEVPSWTK